MHSRDAADITPGPGAYSPESLPEKVRYGAFNKARPSRRGEAENPGPGQYDTPLHKNKVGTRFGKSTRGEKGLWAIGGVAGPGQYEQALPRAGQSSKFAIAERQPLLGNAWTPGPGSYDTDLIAKEPELARGYT